MPRRRYDLAFMLLGASVLCLTWAITGGCLQGFPKSVSLLKDLTRIWACWCGLNFLGMASGYFGVGAQIWGKSERGARVWWARCFWWPARWSMLGWTRWRVAGEKNTLQALSPEVWLGCHPSVASRSDFERMHFAAVLDLAPELDGASSLLRTTHYWAVPCMDGMPPELAAQKIIDWIHDAPKPLLIHCGKGRGRTTTVAMLWLFISKISNRFDQNAASSAEHANEKRWLRLLFDELHQMRPQARLHISQRIWLERYIAHTLKGQT